jgi:hypothetical protein
MRAAVAVALLLLSLSVRSASLIEEVESDLYQRLSVPERWIPADHAVAIGGPDVEAGLHRIAYSFDGSLGNYLALIHFASHCETRSLRILNDHWWKFGIPSYVWAEAVEDFGSCRFKPATANLILALNAASGNVVDAANVSLRRLYPDGPKPEAGDAAVKAWTTWIDAKKGN